MVMVSIMRTVIIIMLIMTINCWYMLLQCIVHISSKQ